ncbi:uncharacterized protein cusr isoform X2 [Genypterus blacodes]|uniref:uncharacterized protein cusr isoform X2 n=1 Tax=Genypterus blacodes TaxID=154954 RepID=UPI003F75C63B
MCLLTVALLFSLLDSFSCVQFLAHLNMGGVTGTVTFDSSVQTATLNVSGAGDCPSVKLSLSQFPVMYGHFAQPCSEANVGSSVFSFAADPASKSAINVSSLFQQRPNLDDFSLTLEACNGTKVCTAVSRGQTSMTYQARFTGRVAGNVYIRLDSNATTPRLLTDLVTIGQINASQTNITLSASVSTAASCAVFLGSLDPSSLIHLGVVTVGTPPQPVKSRLDPNSINGNIFFLLYRAGSDYKCAQVYAVPEKQVSAVVDMRGIKGFFRFRQASPFDVTELRVNLSNLQSRVGPFHVHHFPVPSLHFTSMCSNNNVGGHWNPFGLKVSDPTYPKVPGSTHDMYEIGDLSTKHMSLQGQNQTDAVFTDFNLPLFGSNSIVGRSVVIHLLDGSRFVCSSIGYPGEVIVAQAKFRRHVVGEIWFTQLKDHPLSDVSIFVNLAYGNPTAAATTNHNWHVHTYPISSESDNDAKRCSSTGGHWNPYNVSTGDSYALSCDPALPLACEVGDLSSKCGTINLSPRVGTVEAKNFFTDITSWLPGSGMIGRSVVIHKADRGMSRIACANITLVRVPKASLGRWFGQGTSTGQVRFSQSVPLGPTVINVSLMNLDSLAGGYHVHILPVKAGVPLPCSNANILGHFNPLAWNTSLSPAPGTGTVDQYEIGDISGKFGMLNGLNQYEAVLMDPQMPLRGSSSIEGRSVVLHYKNGSRMQCATISADTNTDGHWIVARADYRNAVFGTITLRQQVFPDGSSSDVTLDVDLTASISSRLIDNLSLFIMSGSSANSSQCTGLGATYNPFNMTSMSSSCSRDNQLSCVVGEISARLGMVSQSNRHVLTDCIIQLAGDNTAILRSLLLKNGSSDVECADIAPVSPSAEQTFPRVPSFSRYDFRRRVSNVLQMSMSRVTILSESSLPAASKCQRVQFVISGDVSKELLQSVKTSKMMGPFQESATCTRTNHARVQCLAPQHVGRLSKRSPEPSHP